MSVPDWSVGHIVGRKYTVQQVLGRTPFTRTYAALTEPNKEVVLRVFGAESSEAVDALMERIPDFAGLPEPGVMRVLEIGQDPASGARFVVTERSRNPSLGSLVEVCPLSLAEGLVFAAKLARTIDAAHAKKLLHLGLSPSNVFVGAMPVGVVEVADFNLPQVGAISFEKARWQAPEQIAEHRPTASADTFAVALLVFHSLTGKSYWRANGVEDLASELSAPRAKASARAAELGVKLPSELDAAFEAALAADPKKRPARAGEFAAALQANSGVATPSVIVDIAPPPDDLLRAVAPLLAPIPIPDAPPNPTPGAHPSSPHQVPSPSPSPFPFPSPSPFAGVGPQADAFGAPPISLRVRRRQVMTIVLSGVAALLFLTAIIIFVAALRKKPIATKGDAGPVNQPVSSLASAAPVGTPSVALPNLTVPDLTTPSATTTASPPATVASANPDRDSTVPTITLGPDESELDVFCDPDPCKLVMVDRKKMTTYPAPMVVAPGLHGVGIDAEGYWGDWKAVTTKAGERAAVTFKLNKRPADVPWPKKPPKK